MKREKRKPGLFRILAANYFIFTLLLITALTGGYLFWNLRIERAFVIPDLEHFFQNDSLQAEEYSTVPVSRYLGNEGAFAVLENGKLLYSSDAAFRPVLTDGELACIPEFGSETLPFLKYETEDGETRYLVTAQSEQEGGTASDSDDKTEVMILDKDYHVLSGKIGNSTKTAYTEKEFDYLTGRWSDRYLLYRGYPPSGNRIGRTILVRVPIFTTEIYRKTAFSAATDILLVIIPFCILLLFLSILWLNRKIRIPLKKLDDAITELREGKAASAAECGGPEEIRDIGRNFDAMEAKLLESEKERKKLEETRRKILADISHDLKTPITVICGYANILKEKKANDADVPKYLDLILEKTDALTHLINTFNEYNQTGHPDFRINGEITDICEYMREYLGAKYDEIELSGFQLDVDIPETALFCRLDSFQFRRVLDNLLSNAFRHNPKGTTLRYTVEENDNHAEITVSDDGKGIPEELKDTIFEPFTVGDQSRKGGGSGLGLSIAKKIVEAHGGSIGLVCPEEGGQGACFRMVLPLEKPDTAASKKNGAGTKAR